MSTLSPVTLRGALFVNRFSTGTKVFAVAIGISLLTASSYIEVPMYPVPMTMQTSAVLLIAALYGLHLGVATIFSWLFLACLGAPLLAGGSGGPAAFVGPTAGYLAGFLVATCVVGWLSDRGWNGMKPHLALTAMVLGGVIIFSLGWSWLASIIGAQTAWTVGVLPFILGDLVKSVFSVAVLVGVHKKFTENLVPTSQPPSPSE